MKTKIPLKLIAEEMKRKCTLKANDGVRARETIKVSWGLIVSLFLLKKPQIEYWTLTLKRFDTLPSDREVIICQNAFFPDKNPDSTVRDGNAVILVWEEVKSQK